jgi:hypothetical protein
MTTSSRQLGMAATERPTSCSSRWRAVETGTPRNLTLVFSTGQGA